VFGIIGGVATLIALLIYISISSLEYNEIGLKYSSFDMTLERTGYPGGVYWVGPFGKFITFPKTYQTVEFSEDLNSDRPSI